MRIAHLSDPHFAKITLDWKQFLSKRWLGNLNLVLFRQHRYQTDHLFELPSLLKSLSVDWICITGDFATTSRQEEFEQAAQWVAQMPAPVLCVPGNHDAYTRASEKEKRFYTYFPNDAMKRDRVWVKSLGNGWWWLGLDCAIATSVLFSNGKFLPEAEKALVTHLSAIPEGDRVILGNHFPFYTSGNPRHDLARHKQLHAAISRFPQIKLYLHGHDHKSYLVDKTARGYPLVLNSGSCAHAPGGTFYIVDLETTQCQVQQGKLERQGGQFSWAFGEKTTYFFP